MENIIKQLISFILPVTVLILVPLYIEADNLIHNIPVLMAGLSVMGSGLYIMIITISKFIRIGKGTLAPWSPTKKLVTDGIYGHVRNPMIMGVIIVLIGESVAVLSVIILLWAVIFFIINNLYFFIYEEPNLEKRFGDEYMEYKKNVHRWIPQKKSYIPHKEFNKEPL
jgi:protein-S-isoprenylcysteine O-methyltransferase Ste14